MKKVSQTSKTAIRSYNYNSEKVATASINSALPSGVTQNRPQEKPRTLTRRRTLIGSLGISNVLSERKKQQVITLGKLGWSVWRIDR